MHVLDRFIKDLHDEKCRFRMPIDEVKDLEEVVNHVVKEFLPNVFNALPGHKGRFRIAEILNAGSYFEQTKIKDPNEFDFMVVVQQLSNGGVSLTPGCRLGYVNVKAADPNLWGYVEPNQTAEKSFELAMLSFNSFLRQAFELTSQMPAFRGRFGQLTFKNIVSREKPYKTFSYVQTAYFTWRRHTITGVYREKEAQSTLTGFRGDFKSTFDSTTNHSSPEDEFNENTSSRSRESKELGHTVIYSRTGQNDRSSDYQNIPSPNNNRTLDNQCSTIPDNSDSKEHDPGFDLDIDFMTCCHQPFSSFTEVVNTPKNQKVTLEKNGCHVVLKPCGNDKCRIENRECRLVSYTRSEQDTMRQLDKSWKTVYKVMKWLFSFSDILGVDSYRLKTAILHLSSTRKQTSLGDGSLLLLSFLRNCIKTKQLPCFFKFLLNVWDIPTHYELFVYYKVTFFMKLFERIDTIPDEDYNFDELQRIVDGWVLSFCKPEHVRTLHALAKSHNLTEFVGFCDQGNTFLGILDDLAPFLQRKRQLKRLTTIMKCYVLSDVLKFCGRYYFGSAIKFILVILIPVLFGYFLFFYFYSIQ